MKTWVCIALAAAALGHTDTAAAAGDDLAAALQKGLFEEEANHNFPAAMDAYSAVISRFDKDRKLAATAVFRLGECYRKQGKTNEATAQYQRVLREFSDQAQLAPLSRQNLAALGANPAVEPFAAGASAQAEQKRLLEQEIQLIEKTLTEQKKRAEVGAIEPEAIRKTEREILVLKRQLAALEAGTPALATPPTQAITSTEAEEVRRIQVLIKDSPDLIDAKDSGGNTPLHFAAQRGELIVARFLLESRADVNARDSKGETPLYKAAAQGHKAMVELLLAHKADVRLADRGGETSLFQASRKGFKSVVEVLLAAGADVHARNGNGATPLHLAAAEDRKTVMETLLARGADVNAENRQGVTPLHTAASAGHEAAAALLIKAGAAVNATAADGMTPLAVAVGAGHAAITDLLLANKADPNLSYTVQESSPGKSPVKLEYFPLYRAIDNKRMDIAELLLKNQANPDVRSGAMRLTPLLATVIRADDPAVLLRHKANPNIPDSEGRTPLHASLALPELVAQLLAAGADVNATNVLGETPLHWAVGAGLVKMAAKLIDHGADPNLPDQEGMTPLHWAAGLGNEKMTALLLERKADPNVADDLNRTPLDLTRLALPGPYSYSYNGGPGLQISTFQRQTAGPAGLAFNTPVPPGPSRTLRPPGMPMSVQSGPQKSIADLLKAGGAVEDLPRYREITARRSAANYSAVAFNRSTNQWNRFTLLELLAQQYGLASGSPEGGGRSKEIMSGLAARMRHLAFPDLARIRIRHPVTDGRLTWQEQAIDLRPLFASGDCSKDVVLDWGDVVEIPEADHLLNVPWGGFAFEECTNMSKCLSRTVQVVLKGNTNNLVLGLDVRASETAGVTREPTVTTAAPFWIRPVLRSSGLLRASSDLTRIKVTRRDPADGNTKEWILDCSDNQPAPDLWLRDGDIIEVPDRE